MKFLLRNLLIFLTVYIIIHFTIFAFNSGHQINYNIGNFNVSETFSAKDNSYYFNIKEENTRVNFQINENYNKAEKIIKKIYYKEIDGYKCFLPLFKNKNILTDIICLKNSVIYNAHDLDNSNINDYFKKYGYNKDTYIDNADEISISNTQKIYKKNMPEDNYIAIENYKGLTLFNSKENNIKVFENDVYKKPISIFTDKYYIVADYNSKYTFKNFYVVNIINGDTFSIRSYDEISFDSYIQGSVGGDVYIFDKDSKKQYKISIKYESVEEVGNKDSIKYYNGKWKTISLSEALNEKRFTTYKDIDGYAKVDKINNNYYFYKKENNKYLVYKAYKQNKKTKTYLFETTDLNSVTYLKDKVYYRNKNNYYYYSKYGSRKVLTNTELEFNDDISLGVYEK